MGKQAAEGCTVGVGWHVGFLAGMTNGIRRPDMGKFLDEIHGLRLDSVVLGDLIVRTSLMTLQSFVQEKNKCNAH